MLTTLLFWSYMALSNPLLWVGAVLLFALSAPFDRRRRLLHLYTCAWAYHYVKLLPLWRPRFEGVSQIERIGGLKADVAIANALRCFLEHRRIEVGRDDFRVRDRAVQRIGDDAGARRRLQDALRPECPGPLGRKLGIRPEKQRDHVAVV